MDEHDSLAVRFEEHRGTCKSVAYRMLGSLAEADDAVQEAWLRVTRADTAPWRTWAAGSPPSSRRICLNVLRCRHREEPLDVHVPDPILARLDRGVRPGAGGSARRLGRRSRCSSCWRR